MDIFPPSEAQPYRIEFWDNDVDTVSLFDVNTQRRTEPVDGVRITPAKEYRAEIAEKLLEAITPFEGNEYADEDAEKLRGGILPKHDRWLPACYGKAANILDYADKDTTVVFFEYNACMEAVDGFASRLKEDIKTLSHVRHEWYSIMTEISWMMQEIITVHLDGPMQEVREKISIPMRKRRRFLLPVQVLLFTERRFSTRSVYLTRNILPIWKIWT